MSCRVAIEIVIFHSKADEQAFNSKLDVGIPLWSIVRYVASCVYFFIAETALTAIESHKHISEHPHSLIAGRIEDVVLPCPLFHINGFRKLNDILNLDYLVPAL